jgi:hypothetical protein
VAASLKVTEGGEEMADESVRLAVSDRRAVLLERRKYLAECKLRTHVPIGTAIACSRGHLAFLRWTGSTFLA